MEIRVIEMEELFKDGDRDLLQQGVTFHSQLLSALCVIPLLCILISSHTGSSLSLPTAISTEPNYLTDGAFSNHVKISFSQPSDSWDLVWKVY